MNTHTASIQKPYYAKTVASPLGELTLVASDIGLAAVLWPDDKPGRVNLNIVAQHPEHPILIRAGDQLRDYFGAKRTTFDLPLDFKGTDFQKRVWEALLKIPFGETRSYSEIAREIGQPTATRAVGSAANRNPISIIAPCHRVIGSNGDLGGYAGGLEAKKTLLRLEDQ